MTVDSTKREHAPPRAQRAHGSRRALARAVRGAALDLAEATVLLAGRGADLDVLCESAASVRDVGPEALTRRRGDVLAEGLHPGDPPVP